jgi:hypothetical protein
MLGTSRNKINVYNILKLNVPPLPDNTETEGNTLNGKHEEKYLNNGHKSRIV